jgi:signal transduction histidine kinase/CheY-like chemotaxis protein
MRRFGNFLLAPLRLISRPVALLTVALLLLGAWGLATSLQTVQVANDAFRSLTASASAVVASFDAPLENFVELTESVRAPDLQSSDRVALTSRLLRLQGALPRVGATFAVSASGQLLAASSPYSPADASVGDTDWFRRALADSPTPLTLQRVESWLRPGSSAVITRQIHDPAGKLVGLVGAILRTEDLARFIGHTWLEPNVAIELRGGDGASLLPNSELMSSRPVRIGQSSPQWSVWLTMVVGRLIGLPPQLSVTGPLRIADAVVTVRSDTDIVLQSHWVGARATGVIGIYLFVVWLACMALAARATRAQAGDAVSGFGADWQVDLDKRGLILATHGYAPDRLREMIGSPLIAALGLESSDPASKIIGEALDARARQDNIQVSIVSEGDQERIHQFSIEPSLDGKFQCLGRDVTREMRLIAESETAIAASQAARNEALATTRDRDRVLAALGHDVRTPMNSIMGICSLLLDSELEQEQRIWLERIRASCEALLAMLNGLLEIASGEVDGAALQLDEVDVIGLVQEVTETLQPQARDKGLELKTRYDDLLRGHWRVDPTRLRQVLFNLLGNAIKFTASGHVELRASAAADASGATSVKLAISDTGPGIAPDDRVRIFERFQRGGAEENSGHAGLGLGLALCRENAVLMSGALTVESALGVGSEFTFEFPAERIPTLLRNQRFAGRNALLVGGEDSKVRTIASQLGDAGVMVETAPDGYLGLALAERIEAQRGVLDLVIVQGRLAGMPAEIFVLRLRDTAFGRRTVMIWLGEGGEAAEVDAVVAPPVDPYQVASLAQQLLAQRSPIEALEPMAPAARGGRVLVVEDDKVNQSLLVAALSRRGFSAFVANDGDEAVRLASHDSFDAILMDIQMPHRDGLEATRRIRSLGGRVSRIPIIALTGLKGPVMRKRCAEAGFTEVLEKPVNLDRLGATLRRWLPGGMSAQSPRDPETGTGSGDEAITVSDKYAGDVSLAFLEEMVAVVGMERARACVADFVADATARCMRLGELLPGWEAGAIVRNCEEISGLAETCGAVGLGEVLEEIADAVTRNDRSRAEGLVERLEAVTSRLGSTMATCLDDIERRWKGPGNRAA